MGFACNQAIAHDFWLEPKQFTLSSPNEMPVGFKVGHHHESEDWDLQKYRVVSLQHYHMQDIHNLETAIIEKTSVTPGLVMADLSVAGTHIIAFESNHSVSTLSAEQFNDYAATEGLLAIIEKRKGDGTMQTPGIEIYSRRAKSLIQVGDAYTDDALQSIGHTLEIVPVQHPFKNTQNNELAVKVYFMGQALANATVDLMSLEHSNGSSQSLKTDLDGIATFEMPRKGKWLFNVIWGVPTQAHDNADFETFFASLTLGFE
jgi:uncharacterized GH25 family protein